MKLYSGPLSLFARKVEIALAEKSIGHERVMVPFTQTAGYAPKDPAVLAANPKGQVPVLIDGDLALFDSTVILEYLDDAYPYPPLFPAEPRDRARCRLLELTADEVIMPLVRPLMHRSEPRGPRFAELEAAAARAAEPLVAHYRLLDARLGGHEYFCGDFTVADIAVFLVLFFAWRLRGPGFADLPALSAWYDRMAARPSVARVVAEIGAADKVLSPSLFD